MHHPNEITWYDLVDPESDLVVGQVTRDGAVRNADTDVAARVTRAFSRELLMRDNAIAEELGVCFADVKTLNPDDPAHHDLVFRNLALLTGLLPVLPQTPSDAERPPKRSGARRSGSVQ